MSRHYYRPQAQSGLPRPPGAVALAGGWCWFDRVEVLARGKRGTWITPDELPPDMLDRLTAPRSAIAGLELDRPRIMAIVNVTPDSFSDGGAFLDPASAIAQGRAVAAAGADIVDIGGESTRPGAEPVSEDEERARIGPVISALAGGPPISVDTRNAGVARSALECGASILNDVTALRHDPEMAALAAGAGVPVCLMHSAGDPKTMQHDPRYADVLLDVYDHLEERVEAAVAAGVDRTRIVVDPGIGFGKTAAHNIALIARLSLFHGLGCPVLLGVSRKRFIGSIGNAPDAGGRLPGSLAMGLAGIAQGVQILRVHDMAETAQALSLWMAVAAKRQDE